MLKADGKSAREISEMLLDITGNALLSNDFDTFAQCFHVPHTIETADKKTILKTRAALKDVFDRVVEGYNDKNVTNLVRICEVAEFRGPFRIEATHISHVMSGNLRVMDPYPSFGVLEFIEGRWQATASQYAVDHKTTVGRAFHAAMTDTKILSSTPGSVATDKREN